MAVIHASESQHWYGRDGLPMYDIVGANGKMRPVTLRDARKLSLVPGVSTILGCADKPGLTLWKIEQAIMAALTLPRIDGESSDSFVARVRVDAKEQAKKAAERGTAIHAAIQGWFEEHYHDPVQDPYVRGALDQVGAWYPDWAWEAEQSFAHPLGFGGKVDLSHCAAAFVLDFKTKEFSDQETLKTWDEHAMQLAAYREGLKIPNARCSICYVSVTNPGLSRLIEIPEEELQRGWECFVYLLGYWKAKNRFNPALQEQKTA